jgi:hypothetical protein
LKDRKKTDEDRHAESGEEWKDPLNDTLMRSTML